MIEMSRKFCLSHVKALHSLGRGEKREDEEERR